MKDTLEKPETIAHVPILPTIKGVNWLFRCEKCKTEAKYAAGIGHYCPNPKCENADYGIEEVKK